MAARLKNSHIADTLESAVLEVLMSTRYAMDHDKHEMVCTSSGQTCCLVTMYSWCILDINTCGRNCASPGHTFYLGHQQYML